MGSPQLDIHNKDYMCRPQSLCYTKPNTTHFNEQDNLCSLFTQKCSTQHHLEECYPSISSNVLSNYSGLYDNEKSWHSNDAVESSFSSTFSNSVLRDMCDAQSCAKDNESELLTLSSNQGTDSCIKIPPLEKMESPPTYDNYSDILKPSKAIYYDIQIDSNSSPTPANRALSPYLYVFFHVRKIPKILSTFSIYEIC